MKICVVGTGYVGLSLAVLLAQHHEVAAVDIIEEKVHLINSSCSPIADREIETFLADKSLNLKATTDLASACKDAAFVIIATPTDYDDKVNHFNTTSVEIVLKQVTAVNPAATVVIKSTIPIGFVEGLRQQGYRNVFFSPEFLREGKALYDNLHPSRIVVGEKSERARIFADLLKEGAEDEDVPVYFTGATEAEAVKLFANTYLAVRVAFFNELDSYAWMRGLNTEEILRSVIADPRVGDHYCNPSFGYGGYCLPKDTKQLLADFGDIPQSLISGVVNANGQRKALVTAQILAKKPSCVGIYRLIMKAGSDNFRASAVLDIMEQLKDVGVDVVIYEPTVHADAFADFPVIADLDAFKVRCDVIAVNRYDPVLDDVRDKVICRDLFAQN